jgi:hypothetical protein
MARDEDDQDRDELVDVEYDRVKAATEGAVLLDCGGQEIWFPRSQADALEDLSKGDGPGTVALPFWLAEDRGLI